jgi:predicted small lipoprotein YifL
LPLTALPGRKGAVLRRVIIVFVLGFLACGIKGPPRPPLDRGVAPPPEPPDAGCCREAR